MPVPRCKVNKRSNPKLYTGIWSAARGWSPGPLFCWRLLRGGARPRDVAACEGYGVFKAAHEFGRRRACFDICPVHVWPVRTSTPIALVRAAPFHASRHGSVALRLPGVPLGVVSDGLVILGFGALALFNGAPVAAFVGVTKQAAERAGAHGLGGLRRAVDGAPAGHAASSGCWPSARGPPLGVSS